MANTLTKIFTSVVVQKPSYKVWNPPKVTTTTPPATLTTLAYTYYKNWLFGGADFLYFIVLPIVGSTSATYFDAYNNAIPNSSYSIVFFSSSAVAPFNTSQPRLTISVSQVVLGATTSTTTPGFYETVTPAPYTAPADLLGWNASAASVSSFTGNGNAKFLIQTSTSGSIVVGLVQLGNEVGSAFENMEYAVYAVGSIYLIMESGVPKTWYTSFDPSKPFTIQKKDTVVEYLLDGVLVYTSAVPSNVLHTLVLDAALYKSGDAVIDTSVLAGVSSSGWKSTPINYGVSSLTLLSEGYNPASGTSSLTLSEVVVQESTHNGVDSLRLSDTKELFVNNDIFMESNLKLSSSSAVVGQTKDALAVTQTYSCDVVRFGVSNLYLSQSVIPVQYGVSDLHLSGFAYRVAAGSSDLLLTQVATVEQIRSPKTSLTLAQAYTAVAARGLKSDLVLSSSYTQSRARATAAQHLLKLRQNFTVGVVKAFVPVTPSSGLISLAHQARVGNLAKSRQANYSFEYNILDG